LENEVSDLSENEKYVRGVHSAEPGKSIVIVTVLVFTLSLLTILDIADNPANKEYHLIKTFWVKNKQR
jgi:hypothetical protein